MNKYYYGVFFTQIPKHKIWGRKLYVRDIEFFNW